MNIVIRKLSRCKYVINILKFAQKGEQGKQFYRDLKLKVLISYYVHAYTEHLGLINVIYTDAYFLLSSLSFNIIFIL